MTGTMTDHPNYPFMQAEDTFYGIEFEVAIPTPNVDFPIGSHFHPIQVPHYPQGWKVGSDISIYAPIGYTPAEFVSPKLKGFDGIIQIVQVLDDLNGGRGAIVNHSTGLHIHIDGSNLDVRDIKKIKQMYTIYEKVFFGVMGGKANDRYKNNFCNPSNVWVDNEDDSDRRRSLNLVNWHTLQNKKTVEFRLFAGELKPEKVVTYLYMAMGLVIYARNCTRIHGLKPSSTLAVLAKKFINNVLKAKCNQIVPDFEPTKEDGSMWSVLNEMVPQSTVSL